ncbi:hypothetical protein KKE78_01940 [Patescibacteria group bacterium]|nr:hypothetical protein [Patescibacteria group bacterium]
MEIFASELGAGGSKTKTALFPKEEDRLPEMRLSIQVRAGSKVGTQHLRGKESGEDPEQRNEDAYFIQEKSMGVFDGAGGIKGGRDASQAINKAYQENTGNLPGDLSPEQILEEMKQALVNAAGKITGRGHTTATVVKLVPQEDNITACIVWYGNTRVDILKPDGFLEQVTQDMDATSGFCRRNDLNVRQEQAIRDRLCQSPLQSYKKKEEFILYLGELGFSDRESERIMKYHPEDNPIWLPPPQLVTYLQELFDDAGEKNAVSLWEGRSETSLLSKVPITTDILKCKIAKLHAGDRLVVSTDGVHQTLTADEITEVLKKKPGDLAAVLIREAKIVQPDENHRRGGAGDDMTVVVVEINTELEEALRQIRQAIESRTEIDFQALYTLVSFLEDPGFRETNQKAILPLTAPVFARALIGRLQQDYAEGNGEADAVRTGLRLAELLGFTETAEVRDLSDFLTGWCEYAFKQTVETEQASHAVFIRPEPDLKLSTWPIKISKLDFQASQVLLRQYQKQAETRRIKDLKNLQGGVWLCVDGIPYTWLALKGRLCTPFAKRVSVDTAASEDVDPTGASLEDHSLREGVVGRYDINNGLVSFVAETGELFIGKDTPDNIRYLEQAGYKRGDLYVPFSNGEEPIDEAIKQQLVEITEA